MESQSNSAGGGRTNADHALVPHQKEVLDNVGAEVGLGIVAPGAATNCVCVCVCGNNQVPSLGLHPAEKEISDSVFCVRNPAGAISGIRSYQ